MDIAAPAADAVAVRLPWELPQGFFAGSTLHRLEGSEQLRVTGFESAGCVLRLDQGAARFAPGEPIELLGVHGELFD